MHVTVSRPAEGEIATIAISGELDVANRGSLLDTFARLHEEGHDLLVVDLAELTFIDSSGINALLTGRRAAEQRGGWLRVINVSGPPKRAMELTAVLPILSEPWSHTGPSWSIDGPPAPHTHDDPTDDSNGTAAHGRTG